MSGASQNLAGRSPHAVTRRALPGGQFVDYTYDLAGNQTLADEPGTVKDRRIRFNADGLADRIAVGDANAPSSISSFRYGAGGRYLRSDKVGSIETVTRYLGGVEWITKTGAAEERKRYIGGFLILTETGALNAPVKTYRYSLGDHLGSMDTLVDETGDIIEKLSFHPHGNRRAASNNGVWQNLIGAYTPSNTTHGFTGHEHVDQANIIHMNGRLYDPVLGCMLSADPIIQAPFNAQNLNRYTYVMNNPLSLTDPTGLSWLNDNWRSVAGVVITVAATVICVGTCTAPVAAAVAVGAGAAAGGVASASTEGAVQGAFSAAVFFGIGQYFQGVANTSFVGPVTPEFAATLTVGQTAAKVLAHAVAGGVMAEMGGGKFGNGFLSAGVTQALSGSIDDIPTRAGRVVTAALVGGTVSAATGGKFANGALTGAFSRAFNDEAHPEQMDDFGSPKPDGDFVLSYVGAGKRAWIHRDYVTQSTLHTVHPPGDLESIMVGKLDGQASFRAGVGLGIRIDFTVSKGTRSFFIGGGVVEGVQLVASLGSKLGADEGWTMKSSAGVAAGGAIQISAAVSSRADPSVRGQF